MTRRPRVPAAARIFAGHALYAGFNWLFDQILYLYAVYRLGLVAGGLLMTALSLITCAATLVLYDRMGVDWLGAGALSAWSDAAKPGIIRSALRWASHRGNPAMFLALCVLQDPFVTTAYFRRGAFGGLARRDWALFLAAALVSNAYWTLRCGLLAEVFVRVRHLFGGG